MDGEDPLEKGSAIYSSILGLPLWLRWYKIHLQCRRLRFRSLGWKDPLEETMATHSSILVWRIPMDSGAWRATVHGVGKRWI